MKINILKDTMAEMPYTEVEKLAQKGAVVREICPEFVGDPAGSVYVKSRLRAVDELIAKDIRNLTQTRCAQKTCAEMEKK